MTDIQPNGANANRSSTLDHARASGKHGAWSDFAIPIVGSISAAIIVLATAADGTMLVVR